MSILCNIVDLSHVMRRPAFKVVSPGKIDESEPPHDKTNKVACAPSEDSDQPGLPRV